jgi:hypothetical protein
LYTDTEFHFLIDLTQLSNAFIVSMSTVSRILWRFRINTNLNVKIHLLAYFKLSVKIRSNK